MAGRTARIGLALAGGGPLAAVYEIGALAALEESIEGFDANGAEVYVGISAGAIVAAGLANGIGPHQMVRLFIESDAAHVPPGERFVPELMARPAVREFAWRLARLPRLLAGASLDVARGRAGFVQAFARLREVLPAGLFSGEGLREYLARAFAAPGRSDDFRRLAKKLVIVATDLDTGEAVRFGEGRLAGVPVSLAVQASAAVPGLFPPVEVGGRYYVDGALRKTMHASIALDFGVDLLFCVNPIVPYTAQSRGTLARGGMVDVLSQALRAVLHSRLDTAMERYARAYPHTDILLFQPSERDAEHFFTNIFSYAKRRRMCEQAYQHTRRMLLARRAELAPRLARHGLRLNEAALRDSGLRLVSEAQPPVALPQLARTLDDLERYLKTSPR